MPTPPGHSSSGEAHLPEEMWARVFSYLQPLPHNLMESPEIYIGLPDIQAQRRFFQLPLVCQRFRDVFLGSADLPQVLVIQQNVSQSAFLGLRAWLQRHAAHLQSITSLCADDHTIESLLAILAMSHSRLTSASCIIHSTRQLAALGCLRHLTACTLQTSPAIVGLELTPLQCLPSLQSLMLKRGRFTNLSAVTRLTSLSIFQCYVVMGPRNFDMPLKKLFISESVMDGFGSNDMSSRQSLQHLTLINCTLRSPIQEHHLCISARDGGMSNRTGATIIPAGLSELTGLKVLHVSIACSQAKALTVLWLYNLIHLERLKLVHPGKLILSEGMGALSRLVSMSITCTPASQPARGHCQKKPNAVVNSAPHTVFAFDWRRLGALRYCQIYGDFGVDLRLLGVTALTHLQSITFAGHPWNRSSVSALAIFMYRIAALRPDVHIKMHEADGLLTDSIETIWDRYVVSK